MHRRSLRCGSSRSAQERFVAAPCVRRASTRWWVIPLGQSTGQPRAARVTLDDGRLDSAPAHSPLDRRAEVPRKRASSAACAGVPHRRTAPAGSLMFDLVSETQRGRGCGYRWLMDSRALTRVAQDVRTPQRRACPQPLGPPPTVPRERASSAACAGVSTSPHSPAERLGLWPQLADGQPRAGAGRADAPESPTARLAHPRGPPRRRFRKRR
jgi:hypothetical protein